MRRWTIVVCALVAILAWAGFAQAGPKRITDAATRNEVMGKAMDYLLP